MRVEIGNTKSTLIPEVEGDRAMIKELQNKFKIFLPEALYVQSHQLYKATHGARGWDGRVSLIRNDATILSGLTGTMLEGMDFNVVDIRNKPSVNINPKLVTVPLRDYQQETALKAIVNTFAGTWWPRGIFHLATGAGKTELAVALVQMIPVPTLFVVHRKDLLVQTTERFEKYGLSVGSLGAGIWKPNPMLNVGTIQTITSVLRGKADHKKLWLMSWLPNVEQIFFDEAHMLASKLQTYNTFIALAEAVPAFFRWGLTATPFMRDKYSNLLLEGATGKTLQHVSSAALIKQGYLTDAQIIIQTIMQPHDCPKSWPDAYKGGIVLNRTRNNLIIEWANKVPKPSLIIVKDLTHLRILYEMALKSGLRTDHVSGITPLDKRQKLLKDLSRGKLDTLVCSTIFDEGIDLPELKSLIIAAAGKSVTKVLQRLGRVLRIHHAKDKAYLVDFRDKQARVLLRHSDLRIKTYRDEGYQILEI